MFEISDVVGETGARSELVLKTNSKAKAVLECVFALSGALCAKLMGVNMKTMIFPGADRADRMFIRSSRGDRRARLNELRYERDFERDFDGKPPPKLYLH